MEKPRESSELSGGVETELGHLRAGPHLPGVRRIVTRKDFSSNYVRRRFLLLCMCVAMVLTLLLYSSHSVLLEGTQGKFYFKLHSGGGFPNESETRTLLTLKNVTRSRSATSIAVASKNVSANSSTYGSKHIGFPNSTSKTLLNVHGSPKLPVPVLGNSLPSSSQNSSSCLQPHKRIVFLKTHKTGSSTTATIIERFGYKNSLSFALPAGGHVFSQTYPFYPDMLKRSAPNLQGKWNFYDILVNHVRFDYVAMRKVIPGAKFITIVRHPLKQLESAFGYFEEYRSMNITAGDRAFEVFMQDPGFHTRGLTGWHPQTKSGQIYDLGLETKYLDNKPMIEKKIEQLDKEFDLVMVNEYFDHSLILLKKMLCWKMEDILYFSKGVRSKSHRFDTSREGLKDKILKWNYADFRLFLRFNETLWRKIEEYGYDEFYRELALFQQKQKEAEKTCLEPNIIDTGNRREVRRTLRKTAPDWCVDMLRGDVSFVSLIRRRQNGVMQENTSFAPLISRQNRVMRSKAYPWNLPKKFVPPKKFVRQRRVGVRRTQVRGSRRN